MNELKLGILSRPVPARCSAPPRRWGHIPPEAPHPSQGVASIPCLTHGTWTENRGDAGHPPGRGHVPSQRGHRVPAVPAGTRCWGCVGCSGVGAELGRCVQRGAKQTLQNRSELLVAGRCAAPWPERRPCHCAAVARRRYSPCVKFPSSGKKLRR